MTRSRAILPGIRPCRRLPARRTVRAARRRPKVRPARRRRARVARRRTDRVGRMGQVPAGPYGPGGPRPWPPPPPAQNTTGVVIAMTIAGIVAYVVINFVLFLATLAAADGVASDHKNVALIGGSVILAVIAFGGGTLLLLLRKPWSRGLGLGLMIGWALMTIFTAGFCTGVNPSLYTDGAL
ncbi:hypothetical protein [Microbispora sp. GKU 823]|uniref:hypothetical protein n=1 Tax=Microbispora sp. GKU 823 TaxID=1652100 RepID=UPI00117E0323|nr:hypothetical protein [Microbispora sp. GKU 823]